MAQCENDGFGQQIWYALKEEKMSFRLRLVSLYTMDFPPQNSGEKIKHSQTRKYRLWL